MIRLLSTLAAVSAIALASTSANAATVVVFPGTNVIGASGTGTSLTSPNQGTVAPGQDIYFNVSPQLTATSAPTPVTAFFGDIGIPTGAFTDMYTFLSPFPATASGSVTTSVANLAFGSSIDTTLSSVTFNGVTVAPTYFDVNGNVCTTPRVGSCGASTTFSLNNVPINYGPNSPNTITVSGTSLGNGSYAGQGSLIPAVPEPATWAMMLLGFGAMGFSMRSRRRSVLAQLA